MATPGPGPLKHRGSWIPRRLRGRHWFWPKAAWIGFCWFGRIVDHPLSSFIAWVITLATIFGGGIALDVGPLILFVVVIAMFMFVVARGARLKWEQDHGTIAHPEPPSRAPVTYVGGEHTHFHIGEHRPDAGDAAVLEALQRLRRSEGLPSPLSSPPTDAKRPELHQEPQAAPDPADDQTDGADDARSGA